MNFSNRTIGNREWVIYTLSDPRTNEIRYVGWTMTLERRMRLHLSEARNGKGCLHRRNWIASLLKSGVKPKVEIIETGLGDGWQERERFWIAHHRSIGTRLTNSAIGGEGSAGYHPSEEQRKRQSEMRLGKKLNLTPEGRAAISLVHRTRIRRPISEETRAKLAAASRARVWSAESRERLSKSKLGKKKGNFSKEYCDHMSEVHPKRLLTHCPLGHEYTAENIYWAREKGRRPHRHCRACRKIRSTEASRKRRAAIRDAKNAMSNL